MSQSERPTPEELQSSLPGLVEKLKGLTESLTDEEKMLFSDIIDSAAIHTEATRSISNSPERIIFAKPKSVHATTETQERFIQLPEELGLQTEE